MKKRCGWVGKSVLMVKYHDREWGKPVHKDRKFFEFFVLDCFQAGLSWAIVLNKREDFRKAFDIFDYHKIAKYNEEDFERLINDSAIIRNRLKIRATINNAQRFLEVRKKFGSFSKYIWKFTNGKVVKNKWKTLKEIPSRTELSDFISKDLKKRGFKFVGSTIIYSFLQASGIVNDHTIDCFRYREVSK